MEEVKTTVLAMNPEGSASPNRFKGTFYISCWDIIKYDLTSAVQDFFRGQPLPLLGLVRKLLLSLKLLNQPLLEI